MKGLVIRALIYRGLRHAADVLARSLERSGYDGYYIRANTGEKKPLDPSTRPRTFVFERNT